MHKNPVWQAFLLVVLACTLYYTGLAAYRYYVYASLSGHATATLMDWDMIKHMEDDYTLETAYRFKVGDKEYKSTMEWSSTHYLNDYAAKEAVADAKRSLWTVWYNPSNPDYSTLEKHLPTREVFSALFLWGLFLYFMWLGFYVGTYRT